jgi:hypothetical protein
MQVMYKVVLVFFKTCLRFGNKTLDFLHFTKKMTENYGIEQVKLLVADCRHILAKSYCRN